jgi:hypothetical protein
MRQSDPDGICILNEEVFSGRRISMDHRLQLAACTVTEASAPHLWLPKEGERPATPRLSSSLLDCIMLSLFGEDFTRFTMAFGVAAVRLLVYRVVPFREWARGLGPHFIHVSFAKSESIIR